MSEFNEFETQLRQFAVESEALQIRERDLKNDSEFFLQKFQGFMKENGLTQEWTLPQLALLAVKKSKE